MKTPITTAQAMSHSNVAMTINTLGAMADELRVERDRFAELCDAAQGILDRGNLPVWEQASRTAEYIARLRAALEDLK